MHPIVKLVLGVVLGLVLSFFVITLFESWMSHSYPMNVKNPGNQEYIDAMKTMPVNAFLILIAGYMVSSFFGGYKCRVLCLIPSWLRVVWPCIC